MPTRSVVITGASTGIGKACALHLDHKGWRVFAGVRRSEDAVALESSASKRLSTVMIDVSDQGSIDHAQHTIKESLGENGLTGLVNNAGITVQGPLEHLPLDELRKQMEVNVTGQLAVTQSFLPLIRKAKGRIVFMGSVGAARHRFHSSVPTSRRSTRSKPSPNPFGSSCSLQASRYRSSSPEPSRRPCGRKGTRT